MKYFIIYFSSINMLYFKKRNYNSDVVLICFVRSVTKQYGRERKNLIEYFGSIKVQTFSKNTGDGPGPEWTSVSCMYLPTDITVLSVSSEEQLTEIKPTNHLKRRIVHLIFHRKFGENEPDFLPVHVRLMLLQLDTVFRTETSLE